MRQIILELLADLALQVDSDNVQGLKKSHILIWLLVGMQVVFILFIGIITLFLFIVGWDEQNWGLLALGLICLGCTWLQVSKLIHIVQKINSGYRR